MGLRMRRWIRRLRASLLVGAVAAAAIAVNMALLGVAAQSSGDPVGRFNARLSGTVSKRVPERSAPNKKARATKPRRPAKPTPATTTSSAPGSTPAYDDHADDDAEPGEREDD
jgi:hypothetical protein